MVFFMSVNSLCATGVTIIFLIFYQILLGPNAAVSGTGSQNLLPGIGMMTPGMMGSK